MLQQIILVGNLVADAEIKTSKDGREFIAFRVAVSEGRDEEKRTTYYDVLQNKNGVIDFLKKGQQVTVMGRLSLKAVCKDGQAFINASVSAEHLELGASPREA